MLNLVKKTDKKADSQDVQVYEIPLFLVCQMDKGPVQASGNS